MKTILVRTLVFLLFLGSCAQEEPVNRKEISGISVIPAKGYLVPADQAEPPVKIVAGKPHTVRVNKKNEIKGAIDVELVGPPRIKHETSGGKDSGERWNKTS